MTGHKVAVKILNKAKIKRLGMEEKAQREIYVLSLCTHPHIIRVYEVIDTPTDIFLVNEYVSGGLLFDYIVLKRRLSADEARNFFHQIISGVEYCHFQKIVHRDLKPEHLLLDANLNIKIAAFGSSTKMRDGEFLRTSCGSPHYAAPEIISGHLYAGPEVDVWSCGVTLYALLCGSLPFDDESIPNLFKKIKSGMYSLPTHLSQLAKNLILRMLEVDPITRITIPEIRLHPWFQHKLPPYLRHPPEYTEKLLDREVIDEVLKLPFEKVLSNMNANGAGGGNYPIISRDLVERAATLEDSPDTPKLMRDLRVAYELILDHKHTSLQVMEVARATSATPLAFSPSRRAGGGGGNRSALQARLAEEATRALMQPEQSPVLVIPPVVQMTSSIPGNVGMISQHQDGRRYRQWCLGIQSKKDPAHVMKDVYKALHSLGCEWLQLSSYRINCRWRPNVANGGGFQQSARKTARQQAGLDSPEIVSIDLGVNESKCGPFPSHSYIHIMAGRVGHCPRVSHCPRVLNLSTQDYCINIGLTLYKIKQSVYLLDFQKITGDAFSFMTLCANIITELKTLGAASKQQQAAVAA